MTPGSEPKEVYCFDDLPKAHGEPLGSAVLRSSPEDFIVDELLGFQPDGAGEHVFLRVCKRELTTRDVAKRLACFADVRELAVGFSGMKDRRARTTQWFSVQMPGRGALDWSTLNCEELQILDVARHSRKLRRAQHRANRFRLTLRGLDCDEARIGERLARIAALGVPNYFGPQRFGNAGDNVVQALIMFRGKRLRRGPLRGILISAARSFLFNEVLAERVRAGSWCRIESGDVLLHRDSDRLVGEGEMDHGTIDRHYRSGQVDATGALWGRGELISAGAVKRVESDVAERYREIADGLEQAGLSQQRRNLRLLADGLEWGYRGSDLALAFDLPVGGYATSLVREIARTIEDGER